ncbi:MAG TPA: AAA family ATPase [Gammaproteobacteria bacterium]|nr:AAA family ATPase [Gammaproteobacteria bacterium]
MFEELQNLSYRFLDIKNQKYRRYFIQNTQLSQRLSMLIGQRGIGKTTTLIQYLLDFAKQDRFDPSILYIQADHFVMGNTSLYEITDSFHKLGGKLIAFDEIHKYENWSLELKSIYDTFPDIKIIASGSSALEIQKGSHDLSRRAIIHHLHGLSFREYLELHYDLSLQPYALDEILKNHIRISNDIISAIQDSGKKILSHFMDYLNYGFYPFYREVENLPIFQVLLEQNMHTTIESDLVAIYAHLTGNSLKKIKQLLSFIAQSVPFIPNWKKIKSIVDISDDRTLKTYFKYLEDAELIQTISKATEKLNKLEISEKIYLNNSNQMFALSFNNCNIGTVRETFFLNTLSALYDISLPTQGGFLVNNQFLFEIGGRKKGFQQLKDLKNAFLACDDIETGIGNKIPLWLFGFLY